MHRRTCLSLMTGVLLASLVTPMPAAAASLWLTPWPPQDRQVDVGTTSVVGSLNLSVLEGSGETLTVTAVAISGPDAGDFSVAEDYCTGSHGSCWVSIAFSPTRVGVETARVDFTVQSSTAGEQSTGTPIEAIGGPIGAVCDFASFPKTSSFWDTYVGQARTPTEFERLRVANCGAADLHVNEVILGGRDTGDFVLGPNTCVGTYPATDEPWWQTCFIDITFAPQTPGEKEATVTLVSDGLAAPQVWNLRGRALGTADLGVSISATAEPDPAERGGLANYTIHVTNHGPNTAVGAYVGFWFWYPGNLEPAPADATCGPLGLGQSCIKQLGDLPSGASTQIQVSVRIGTNGIPGLIEFGALNGSQTADLVYENNVASAGLPVEDLEPPTIRFDNNAGTYGLLDFVWIPCLAEDNAGIDWSRTTCPWTTGAGYEVGIGSHTVSASAYDLAGYHAEASTTFGVVADYASVRLLTQWWVTKAGVARELLSMLDAAARAEARGNEKGEAGALADFRSLVKAQSGKAIDPTNATTLIQVSFGL